MRQPTSAQRKQVNQLFDHLATHGDEITQGAKLVEGVLAKDQQKHVRAEQRQKHRAEKKFEPSGFREER
jgi:hypothetical protein